MISIYIFFFLKTTINSLKEQTYQSIEIIKFRWIHYHSYFVADAVGLLLALIMADCYCDCFVVFDVVVVLLFV